MTTLATSQEIDADYFSQLGASRWLRARGIRPHSRHAVALAIARGELRPVMVPPRTMLIHRSQLEAYARAHAARKSA